jgi:CHAT domain-containing protein
VASCLDALGRSDEALATHKAALAMTKQLFKDKNHPDLAASRNDIGRCLYALGRFGEALTEFQAALAMYRKIYADKSHPFVATSLSNVASCLDAMGRSAQALPAHEAALDMTKRLFKGADHPEVAAVLSDVGLCLAALGRSAEALAKYQAALTMAERVHSPEAFKVASHLGRLYLDDLDKPAEAVRALERAAAGMERARVEVGGHELDRARYFAHVRRWGAFEAMIRAQLRLGRADKALEYAERGRALGLRDVLERGERLQGGDLLGPVEAAARARGDAALLRAVADARERQRRTLNSVSTLIAQIRLVRGREDLNEQQRGERIRLLNARLAKAHKEHLSARRAVFNLAGTHAALDLKPLTVDRIQACCAQNQLLLIYTLSDKDSVLLVVPPPGRKVQGLFLKWPDGRPVTSATLDKAVTRYVRGMMIEGMWARGVARQAVGKHSPAEHAALGYRLFRALIPAELWGKARGARQVYVVPDGVLHRLPFETLLVEEPKGPAASAKERRYWVDAGPPLVYGPSATVLVNRKEARDRQLQREAAGSRHQREATLLGDPVFERRASSPGRKADVGTRGQPRPSGWGHSSAEAALVERSSYLTRYGALKKLPGTRQEVRRIYRTLVGEDYREGAGDDRVAVLLGENATRTRLFRMAAGSRYVHLATHGLVDTSDKAIYSSLALTQPTVVTPQDFGFLTLVDLFDHWWGRLGATELVVLSACDTQRGRMESGEGVFGISWGFLYAGTPAVIASLWQVSDKSTAEMMGRLYREISRRRDRAEPSAKLRAFADVRKALRKQYPQPYFWAPFIYIGDPR